MAEEMKLPAALEIIRGNIVKHGNPLGLKGSEVAAWTKDLKLPERGEILYYTGGEYQLLPFVDSLVSTMTKMDTGSKTFSFMAKAIGVLDNVGINATKIFAGVMAKDKPRYNAICYKGAKILMNLGYDICYSGDEEIYSGGLLYELGYWKDLRTHAKRVADVIKKTGAKTIVCSSPHAAEVLKLVYPKIIPDWNVEIKTFVEMVWERRDKLPKVKIDGSAVIHDSCRLARELNIVDEFRDIMEAVGVDYKEAYRAKKWSTCCGGPNKMLFPEISHTVAERRVDELEETGASMILTSCPYCLASLNAGKDDHKAGIEDLIEFLYRGYEA